MAESKNKRKPASSAKKSSGTSRAGKKNTKSTARENELPKKTRRADVEKAASSDGTLAAQLLPYVMVVAAVFFAVCMFAGNGAGFIGGAIRSLFIGLNGGAAYALPFLIVIPVFTYGRDREEGTFVRKCVSLGVIYLFASVLIHVFSRSVSSLSLVSHWKAGLSLRDGGVIGGIVGELMLRAFGKLGTLVLIIAVLIVPTLFMFNITPRGFVILVRYKCRKASESSAERASERREKQKRIEEERLRYLDETKKPTPVPESTSEPQRYRYKKKAHFEADIPLDDEPTEKISSDEPVKEAESAPVDENEIDERIFDEVMRRTKARMAAEGTLSPSDETASEDVPTDEFASESLSDARNGDIAENVHTESSAKISGEEKLSPIIDTVFDDKTNEDENSAAVDLKKIFVNPEDAELLDKLAEAYLNGERDGVRSGAADELSVTRTELESVESESLTERVPEKREYIFPDTSLITEDTEKRDENIREELHANAVKLVETLKSFNVKTKIENVSRGPTITRYELLPEAGIRVRSILNLVDDIALNLATTGVRIEAPIPGKAAVGIEVPNKKRATVHLRTLLEDRYFKNAQSKLLCALGEDVGGESVYLDIAKMPHLLIAGATGMGKSVCINSLIVSLLYNASPEEVKLILIDPKKVELNIYNGIPHLLVPVVSDPKKAAGSLSWAVSEMERRFGLIESVGVRDVNNYNKLTANDPAYEYLPYIVIIIDELADLMMTAPNDVEESVCRLMQKARAAGMHVIIGTQRPSVDVITGLIKANIPSRIAFTVASQVDSRTIIDRAGAENLIGRGDMLYLPVGAAKPIRVQGAFVSEEDVEKVVSFIKSENVRNEVEYSSDVIEQIEKEAAKCGSGKKGSSGDAAAVGDAEDDPMLKSALELAVNSGKISTSLIQRRLSLGYGRAAKLIDRMEQLGYVSPPDGQKPREVLITKEQFMEMVLKREDELL